MNIGIYKIVNLVNGKMYIGSAANIKKRWLIHKNELRKHIHHSIKLQRAWNKYEGINFKFEIIEECEKEKLISREQYYIDLYDVVNNGYNCNPIAGSNLGRKLSNKTKKKMSESAKGKKMSNEAKKKISNFRKGRKPWNIDIQMSKKTKKKMSDSKSGIKHFNYNSTPIIQSDIQGNFIKEWMCLFEIRKNGLHAGHISEVCRNLRKSYHGFIWRFKD